MDGTVKAASGEALAGALTGTAGCATSCSPKSVLFFGDDDQLCRDIRLQKRCQRFLAEYSPSYLQGIVTFNEHGTHKPQDRILVWKNANDL